MLFLKKVEMSPNLCNHPNRSEVNNHMGTG